MAIPNKRVHWVVAMTLLLACHSAKVVPSPAREKAAGTALKEIDATNDAPRKARIAASALSEPEFGFAKSSKGFEALASENVDGGQRALIIAEMFEDDSQLLHKAFDKACSQSFDAMHLRGMEEQKRLKVIIDSCHRPLDAETSKKTSSMALALAVAVESHMKERGDSEPALKLARALVTLP